MEESLENPNPIVKVIDVNGVIQVLEILDDNNNEILDLEDADDSKEPTKIPNETSKPTANGSSGASKQHSSGPNVNENFKRKLIRRNSYHTRKNAPLKVKIIRFLFLAFILIAGIFVLLFPPVYHWQVLRHRNSTETSYEDYDETSPTTLEDIDSE